MKQTQFQVINLRISAITAIDKEAIKDMRENNRTALARFSGEVDNFLADGWQIMRSGQHEASGGTQLWVHLVKTE